MLQEALKILKKHFGYSSFKDGQEKVISSILDGMDTFGVMPTGGGKSVCYQIPALIMPGVALVISPLISLMKDQVDALTELGIPSSYINSSLEPRELNNRIYFASKGKYKILYVAPERLESESFRELLKSVPISLLAIDEAHCVSQWGHDFRASYRSISNLIDELTKRPIVAAFTATATESVRHDVIKLLNLKNPNVYITGFDRQNLFFSVVRGATKPKFISAYIGEHRTQAGIIYAATRKEVDKLHGHLLEKGYSVGKYHAGMSDEDRVHNQDAFIFDRVQVMVATNAFGMGIDKSNVRYVIHLNMPKNIEAYYQEAGRAGRDGDAAECIILFAASDVQIQKFMIEQSVLTPERKNNEHKKLQSMIDYCHTTGCLRKYILEYFSDEYAPANCGNCHNCTDDTEQSDITIEAQKIFSCIKRMGELYGAALVANVLRGSNTKKIHELGFNSLSTYGIMKEYTINEITSLINLMAAEDYLFVSGGQYPTLRLQEKAVLVLKGKGQVLQRIAKKAADVKEDTGLFDALRILRKEISQEESVPPYVIFHDSTLKEMSKYLPTDRTKMLNISGVGETKFNKFGDRFIEIIKHWMSDNGVPETLSRPDPVPDEKIIEEKTPSHIITHQMYLEGKQLNDIARERDMALITVQGHIVRCFQEGLQVDWDAFIPEQHEQLILQVIESIGASKLKPLKEALPEEVDYFSIKAVICKYAKEG